MRVLITQPAQEAAISARALTARGHEPISIAARLRIDRGSRSAGCTDGRGTVKYA